MENKLSCIIIDDEVDAIEGFSILLKAVGNVEILSKIKNPEIAAKKVLEQKPDVVFLDIYMPVKNGFEVLDEINSLKFIPKVVFVTAYDQYILRALRNSVFDYLTKPVDRLELKEVLNRIIEEKEKDGSKKTNVQSLNMLKIPTTIGYIFLRKDDIVFIKADGNYSEITTTQGKEISSHNLGKFEQKLKNDNFIRISKSLLVNLMYLSRFERKKRKCILKANNNSYELTVSRRNVHLFDNLV